VGGAARLMLEDGVQQADARRGPLVRVHIGVCSGHERGVAAFSDSFDELTTIISNSMVSIEPPSAIR